MSIKKTMTARIISKTTVITDEIIERVFVGINFSPKTIISSNKKGVSV